MRCSFAPDAQVEHFDEKEVFDAKIEKLAKAIKEAKHFIVFTGAGISTGAVCCVTCKRAKLMVDSLQ